jgi:anthranilate phosphoribosyltransferase
VRVVAVTHPEVLDAMGLALGLLTEPCGRALLMRASEGEPYAHLRRRAQLYGYFDGQRQDLHPSDSSDIDWPLSDANTASANAELIRAMLAGAQPIPPRINEQVQALLRLAA